MSARAGDAVRRVSDLLRTMEFVSEGSASRPPDGSVPSHPGSRRPSGSSRSLHDAYVERLEYLVMRMEKDLDHAKRGIPLEHRADRNKRILSERWQGHDAKEVAVWEDLSVSRVREIRQEGGQTPKWGYPIEAEMESP